MAEEKRYNVVFVYTKKAGGYKGVRFWTIFPDKEFFEKWYTDELKSFQKIMAEGITQEDAIIICQQTPLQYRLNAAYYEAIDLKAKKIDQDILNLKLSNIAFSLAKRTK